MEYTGLAVVGPGRLRGDPATREFIAFWIGGDPIVAGMKVNVWDVVESIRQLIRGRVPVDDRRLGDRDVPLTELTRPDEGVTRAGRPV